MKKIYIKPDMEVASIEALCKDPSAGIGVGSIGGDMGDSFAKKNNSNIFLDDEELDDPDGDSQYLYE